MYSGGIYRITIAQTTRVSFVSPPKTYIILQEKKDHTLQWWTPVSCYDGGKKFRIRPCRLMLGETCSRIGIDPPHKMFGHQVLEVKVNQGMITTYQHTWSRLISVRDLSDDKVCKIPWHLLFEAVVPKERSLGSLNKEIVIPPKLHLI